MIQPLVGNWEVRLNKLEMTFTGAVPRHTPMARSLNFLVAQLFEVLKDFRSFSNGPPGLGMTSDPLSQGGSHAWGPHTLEPLFTNA